MVKTFYFPSTTDPVSHVVYDVVPSDGGLTISFTCFKNGSPVSGSVFVDYSLYSGSVLQIGTHDTDVLNEVFLFKIFDSVDSNTFKRNFQTSSSDLVVARVIINEDASDICVFLTFDTVMPDGADWIGLVRSSNCLTGFMKAYSPFFDSLLAKKKIKAKMLNNVDVFASVSYLEGQVDTLTRALISLLPANHPLLPILNEANSHSVLDVKPVEQIISEFNSDKSKVRSLQTSYYAEKNSIN